LRVSRRSLLSSSTSTGRRVSPTNQLRLEAGGRHLIVFDDGVEREQIATCTQVVEEQLRPAR
jgi:hypothetical protein